jgi:RimJ/RimL family protein N-acetyltransferase
MVPELKLQTATDAELPFLAELAADPAIEPFLAPGAGAEGRLRAIVAEPIRGEDPSGLFVIRRADGEPVGGLALRTVSERSRLCELTRLMVSPRARRQGIGAAAVSLACRRALVDYDFHRLQAETYGDNVPAQRLFERAGFVREGIRRRAYWRRGQWLDGVIYGILAEDLPAAVLGTDGRRAG